ncbi:hypothetical protein BT69DRAFT_1294179 [Atractiella rhizophila]|nr:hypothetical protein BT69DRAFT_1294179 [Atractiella rhizophila]
MLKNALQGLCCKARVGVHPHFSRFNLLLCNPVLEVLKVPTLASFFYVLPQGLGSVYRMTARIPSTQLLTSPRQLATIGGCGDNWRLQEKWLKYGLFIGQLLSIPDHGAWSTSIPDHGAWSTSMIFTVGNSWRRILKRAQFRLGSLLWRPPAHHLPSEKAASTSISLLPQGKPVNYLNLLWFCMGIHKYGTGYGRALFPASIHVTT